MHDAGKIIGGLIIFLVIVTVPIWYQLASGTEPGPPEVKIVTEEKNCVAATEYMRAMHMDLLNQWRDQVVRVGNRIYTGLDGRKFDMSLSRTCMKCHPNKTEFCDKCHNYAGVAPYCWDCHVEPRENP